MSRRVADCAAEMMTGLRYAQHRLECGASSREVVGELRSLGCGESAAARAVAWARSALSSAGPLSALEHVREGCAAITV